MKIPPGGAVVFRVDRRTDRHDEANSRFTQFVNTLKNGVKTANTAESG
jgi:hypothetical protein